MPEMKLGAKIVTDVFNLKTGEVWSYSQQPEEALMCAVMQEKGNYATWMYNYQFEILRPQIKKSERLGKTILNLRNWSCIPGVDLLTEEGDFERKVQT